MHTRKTPQRVTWNEETWAASDIGERHTIRQEAPERITRACKTIGERHTSTQEAPESVTRSTDHRRTLPAMQATLTLAFSNGVLVGMNVFFSRPN